MKRIIFAFCILAVLGILAVASLAQDEETKQLIERYAVESQPDYNVVKYEIGKVGDSPGLVTIDWRQNYLSFYPEEDPWISYSFYNTEKNALPIHFTISLSKDGTALDTSILPENLRSHIDSIAYMATETLRLDEEAGKLPEDAKNTLIGLRDKKYSLEDRMGNYIDLRWSGSYAGSTTSHILDFTNGDSYFRATFAGDTANIELQISPEIGSFNGVYTEEKLTGIYSAGRNIDRDMALVALRLTLADIHAVMRISKQKPPDDVVAGLKLLDKAVKGGFASFSEEEAAPTGGT